MRDALQPLDLTELGGRLLTRSEAAYILSVSVKTMSNWAHIGRGPRVVWIAKNEPRYSLSDINAWLTEVNASVMEAKSA